MTKHLLKLHTFSTLRAFPELTHGTFLREGGVSAAPYDSLNAAENVGDRPENVEHNLTLIQDYLGVKRLHFGNQVHGTDIIWVTRDAPSLVGTCDALITKQRGVGLMIKHADCQATLFFDPKQQIIAAVHCGWKGNVQRIYTKVIEELINAGSHPLDLTVCVSPSLGPDHAEFKHYEQEFPPALWPFQVKPTYFDLWAAAHRELVDCGIPEAQIEIASICTFCQKNGYFSYRRDGVTGRNATVIALKS